jgi:peptidoglycan/xylan/chitin deacetylase (PgdA/CDA1 family)
VKRRLYSVAGGLAYGVGMHRILLRERAVIAVFHRIDDDLKGNPITVTRGEFGTYLDFFSRYFHVVPLRELVDRLTLGRPLGNLLAITFDDGYRDNHEIAALELERRGLPATFFITTGFVGTDLVPPWDAKLGIRSRWMTWDQVRDLHARGFGIGAHTVTHPDFGVAPPEHARREADEGRRELESRVHASVLDFCLPFGGRANVTETNRQVVRELGFKSCMSCYGGTVRPGDDPFSLRRAPISPWHRGPGQWGLEALVDRAG